MSYHQRWKGYYYYSEENCMRCMAFEILCMSMWNQNDSHRAHAEYFEDTFKKTIQRHINAQAVNSLMYRDNNGSLYSSQPGILRSTSGFAGVTVLYIEELHC